MKQLITSLIALTLLVTCKNVSVEPSSLVPSTQPESVSDRPAGDTGKLALALNFDNDPNTLTADDFLEVKGFRTQSLMDSIAKVRVKVSHRRRGDIVKEASRAEINAQKTLVMDVPAGSLETQVDLLDANNQNLASDSRLIKVAANQVVPLDFDLAVPTVSQAANSETGGLAITIHVREQTRLFGALEVSATKVKVGEPVSIRVNDIQGTASRYQFDTGDANDVKISSQPVVTHHFDEPGRYLIQASLAGEGGSSGFNLTAVSTGYESYTTLPQEITVTGQGTVPTGDSLLNNPSVKTIKTIAENPLFKIIKASDPGGEMDLMNRQVLKQVAKGTVKTVSIAGTAVNVLEIYNDLAHGYNEVQALGDIDSATYYTQDERDALKILLAFEVYLKHFGKYVFGGGLVSNGLFRKTGQFFMQHNRQISEVEGLNGHLTLTVQSGSWYRRQKEGAATVKLRPVKVRYFAGGDWFDKTDLKATDSRLGSTNEKGMAQFRDLMPGLWAASITPLGKPMVTRMLRIVPALDTSGYTQNETLRLDK